MELGGNVELGGLEVARRKEGRQGWEGGGAALGREGDVGGNLGLKWDSGGLVGWGWRQMVELDGGGLRMAPVGDRGRSEWRRNIPEAGRELDGDRGTGERGGVGKGRRSKERMGVGVGGADYRTEGGGGGELILGGGIRGNGNGEGGTMASGVQWGEGLGTWESGGSGSGGECTNGGGGVLIAVGGWLRRRRMGRRGKVCGTRGQGIPRRNGSTWRGRKGGADRVGGRVEVEGGGGGMGGGGDGWKWGTISGWYGSSGVLRGGEVDMEDGDRGRGRMVDGGGKDRQVGIGGWILGESLKINGGLGDRNKREAWKSRGMDLGREEWRRMGVRG
ncbi:hypothetical protein Tco_1043261 [Tanacetum coccineum]|uniref:Uncharacterized protein n=1 Tax=Tanacetum coccineum TaxID=301880 RepID=A0ABQ5GLP7_9ASTR